MLSSVIVFVLVLSVLILIHEIGHFIAARSSGVLVEEFGFGLPPRIWGKKIGETLYSINLLPFGGFVRLHGENSGVNLANPKRAFINKNKRTRALIIVAGVIMNAILAVVAFGVVYSVNGIPRETENVSIVDVAPASPAQTSGLLVGDIVRTVEGEKMNSLDFFIASVADKRGKTVKMGVEREVDGVKEIVNISTKPRAEDTEGEGPLGVVVSTTEIYFPPVWQRPFVGMWYGMQEALYWGQAVVVGFFDIFANLFSGVTPKDVAGPVGIFAVTAEASKSGPYAVVNFVGILSVNLAILNIIPFPALDGGRLLFIAIEAFLGKKVVPKVENTAHTIGMVILLFLIFAITAGDIKKLIEAGGLEGFSQKFLQGN